MMADRNDQPRESAIQEGARNLLENCVGLEPDQTLLIVLEDGRLGYFDDAVGQYVADQAAAMGAQVHRLIAPRIEAPKHAPQLIKDAMRVADHTIFLARIGDQMRFYPLPGAGSKTMCYALDTRILGSEACRMPYGLMVEILDEIQSDIDQIGSWRITCPSGTDIAGTSDPDLYADNTRLDFTLKLFPLGPFRPLTCAHASGKVVTRFLPASATHLYEPFGVVLDEPVTVMIEKGRIADFQGRAEIADQARAHYEHVGQTLGIDPFVVHSWHAGTNPKIFYPDPPLESLERWNGVIHSHPRYAHLHTCGDYGPGEIALPIFDPSITFDNKDYWLDGALVVFEQERFLKIAERHGCSPEVFEMCGEIGF